MVGHMTVLEDHMTQSGTFLESITLHLLKFKLPILTLHGKGGGGGGGGREEEERYGQVSSCTCTCLMYMYMCLLHLRGVERRRKGFRQLVLGQLSSGKLRHPLVPLHVALQLQRSHENLMMTIT